MATFAGPPKCTTVYVVFGVTRITVRCRRDLGDVLGSVASVTVETAVRPGQWVVCLCIVIKAPSRPTIRVVAERAIWSEAPFVMLVPVARCAREQRVLEPQ